MFNIATPTHHANAMVYDDGVASYRPAPVTTMQKLLVNAFENYPGKNAIIAASTNMAHPISSVIGHFLTRIFSDIVNTQCVHVHVDVARLQNHICSTCRRPSTQQTAATREPGHKWYGVNYAGDGVDVKDERWIYLCHDCYRRGRVNEVECALESEFVRTILVIYRDRLKIDIRDGLVDESDLGLVFADPSIDSLVALIEQTSSERYLWNIFSYYTRGL